MRCIVDECTGPAVAQWLRQQQHDVLSVCEQSRGVDDDTLPAIAVREKRVIITNDKDFGEMVFRERRPHCGVILLRLADERAGTKVTVIERLMRSLTQEQIANSFVVATDDLVRIARRPGAQ